MFDLFKRAVACDTAALGKEAVALRMPGGAVVPAGCVGVAFTPAGQLRRVGQGARMALAAGEQAFCFHPGPYTVDLLPFAAAPELGLRLSFGVDRPDPRVAQQRFDLYLMSEGGAGVPLAALAAALEAALQRELAQGNLALPPCTSLDEWQAFRAALDQLCYTRFGLMVDDCLPVDLGEQVDYAALLLARAANVPVLGTPAPLNFPVAALAGERANPADRAVDAPALRRLFLELPCLMSALRLAVLPPGQVLFRQHQALLQRLDQVSLAVATMPALELAAPGQMLALARQDQRAQESLRAVTALDEAWALLARLNVAPSGQLAPLFDEADRIVANLECHCAARRLAMAGEGA